jgi:hypothetical protein
MAKPKTAKTPKNSRVPKAPSQPSHGLEGKAPAPDEVRDLVETLAAYDDQKKALTEGAKETLDSAVEAKHFDKTALGWARTLYKRAKKDPEGFAVSLPHFLSYIDDLRLAQIADNSRGMLDDEKPPRITDADVVHSEAA